MRSDLFGNFKYESSTIIYLLGLDILCVTYFLTSIIMPDPQIGDMRQKRKMMSTLPLAWARLSKLWILCQSDI